MNEPIMKSSKFHTATENSLKKLVSINTSEFLHAQTYKQGQVLALELKETRSSGVI